MKAEYLTVWARSLCLKVEKQRQQNNLKKMLAGPFFQNTRLFLRCIAPRYNKGIYASVKNCCVLRAVGIQAGVLFSTSTKYQCDTILRRYVRCCVRLYVNE